LLKLVALVTENGLVYEVQCLSVPVTERSHD